MGRQGYVIDISAEHHDSVPPSGSSVFYFFVCSIAYIVHSDAEAEAVLVLKFVIVKGLDFYAVGLKYSDATYSSVFYRGAFITFAEACRHWLTWRL